MNRLCELYPGICLTTEEKARINLSQGSVYQRFMEIINTKIHTKFPLYLRIGKCKDAWKVLKRSAGKDGEDRSD